MRIARSGKQSRMDAPGADYASPCSAYDVANQCFWAVFPLLSFDRDLRDAAVRDVEHCPSKTSLPRGPRRGESTARSGTVDNCCAPIKV